MPPDVAFTISGEVFQTAPSGGRHTLVPRSLQHWGFSVARRDPEASKGSRGDAHRALYVEMRCDRGPDCRTSGPNGYDYLLPFLMVSVVVVFGWLFT